MKKLVASSVETQEYYQRESYRWSNNRKEACHFNWLKHRNTIREKVIGGQITVKKLVTSSVEKQEYYQRES